MATLTDCTLSGNSASSGGGLENLGTANLILTDCTLSGNSASSDGAGLENDGTATLTDCTISGNSANSDGGGLANYDTATLTDTIVAGNTNPSGASDIGGPTNVSGRDNLVGTGGSGGLVNGVDGNIVLTSLTELGLAPLGNYGGPTQTMALLSGSAAIGAGIAVSGVTTDQRGFPLDSPNPDIGAFQTQPALVVNTTSDGIASAAGDLNLRQAVNLANVLTGAQSIGFDPTVFASPQTITLTGGQLELSNGSGTETITGPTAGVTIDAGGNSRVFQVDLGVTASLSGLTISGGSTTGGGGLFNEGTATVTDCTISGNSADSGGGLDNPYRATLTLTDCTLSGNTAKYDGGGLDNLGTATLTDCTLSGNSAGFGGGLFNSRTAVLTDCTLSGNSASGKNGRGYAPGGLANYDTATLTDTIVAGNTNPSGASDIGGDSNVSGSDNLVGTGGSGGWSMGSMATSSASPIPSWPRWATTAGRRRPWPCCPAAPPSARASPSAASPPTSAASRSTSPPRHRRLPDPARLVVDTTSDGAASLAGDLSSAPGGQSGQRLDGSPVDQLRPHRLRQPADDHADGGTARAEQQRWDQTITGPAAGVTISGGGNSRVFQVDSGVTAALSGLTITGGSISGNGGGLYNVGTVTLTDCTISGNSAGSSGGGLDNRHGDAHRLHHQRQLRRLGGGLDSYGTATLTDCTVSGNSAFAGGLYDHGTTT